MLDRQEHFPWPSRISYASYLCHLLDVRVFGTHVAHHVNAISALLILNYLYSEFDYIFNNKN